MDILYHFTDALKTRKLLVPWADKSVKVIKAGTPFDANGAIANGETAIGLVAQDYPEEWAKEIYPDGKFYAEVEVITAGYIDLAAAEANCGLTYSDDLKAALTGIVFCDGALPAPDVLPAIEESDEGKVLTVDEGAAVWAEASGGGGGALAVLLNVSGNIFTFDKTWREVKNAIDNSVLPYFLSSVGVGYAVEISHNAGSAYVVNVLTTLLAGEPSVLSISCDEEDGYPSCNPFA